VLDRALVNLVGFRRSAAQLFAQLLQERGYSVIAGYREVSCSALRYDSASTMADDPFYSPRAVRHLWECPGREARGRLANADRRGSGERSPSNYFASLTRLA
jgi:hypothetical protein